MSERQGSTLVIDSSVFISALTPAEEHAGTSQAFFRALRGGAYAGVVVPTTVVLEVGNILMQKGRLARSAPMLASVQAHFEEFEIVPVDDEFVSAALLLFPRLALRTADAIVAVTASLYDAALVSWDARLLRGARVLVSALTPAEFLRRNQER